MQRTISILSVFTVLLSNAEAFVQQPKFGTRQFTYNLKMAGPEIEVISQPSKDFLEKKGVFNWGTWGCGVSTFPWSYDSAESCYLLEGKVTVTPTDDRKAATFGKGDFVTFPAGMSCEWAVTETVKKHFMFF
uniref:(S)-ureidoglycine aminohydrolase cupin domain-containing protein n=1 Tax=Corethron hystrix TaxID=216773 RepID=A0A7S1BQQ5_9STRA|mmetsp:Transcript_34945/g.80811  ORF Transcript_34945/g.80811 Transcript_34945/m.80811 type:complete len:132 (+) Transcript_34945:150-545(+)